ncbi:MAG TPA: 23S rRNA (guanosine(2251)-2'-O)-methyltransferase RlmB [Rhodospirillaceae bacterium]|nr:23S rRNA (guanosine(2251)-2'-O)-methyltransferase RlmB [Rhodospirillaceae bacterium]
MKSSPRKPGGKPAGKPTGRPSSGAKRPSFGKSFHKPAEGRKAAGGASSGGFDKKPRRFDRSDDSAAAPREEGFKKRTPARFGEKPAFGKRDDHRKPAGASSGGFDRKPRRFTRDDDSAAAPREEGFKKRPSTRFGEKPAFGKRDDHRKPAGASSGGFDRKPRRFTRDDDAPSDGFKKSTPRYAKKPSFHKKHESAAATPQKTPAPAFEKREKRAPLPRRESLQRQGVLLWGLHAVREAWLNPKRKCYRLWTTEAGQAAMADAMQEATQKELERPAPLHAEKSDIEHFLPQGSVHQGVALEVEPLKEITLDDYLGQENCPEIVVILDQVTDPHNVGAILRSAAAFGAGAVIVTERNAPSTTGIMAKTASGAAEHVPLISVVNIARALDMLQAESFWCVGLAEEGEKDMSESSLHSGRVALVMGAEGEGLRRLTREHCDELARLPTGGRIGSLNVSNAAAVALYEVKRQRG